MSNVNFTLSECEFKMFKGLIKRIFCSIIFCLMMLSSYGASSIPFELINGLIIVKAEIDGMPGNYIIDSGSNGILLNTNSEKSDVSYQTLSTTLEGSETKIETFKVGDFEAYELIAFSTDISNLEAYLDIQISGILGCSIFTPNSLGFDFRNSIMIISENKSEIIELKGLTSLPYSVIDDLPLVDMEIAGNTYTFILDSGASSHFVDIDLLEIAGNTATTTGIEKSIVTAGGMDQRSLEYKITNCKIGEQFTSLKAFEKDFAPISHTMEKEISGLLSLSKLSPDIVFFDLKSKKFYYNQSSNH